MSTTIGPSSAARPGSPFPLGATVTADGTNFSVASDVADERVLCLFDAGGSETQIPLRDVDVDVDAGVWHACVPGVGPGQLYGYRATGPFDPSRGLRCNPAKLLVDPYARALQGAVALGPEVLDHDPDNPARASSLDSAGYVPRSIVVDAAFDWSSAQPPSTATRTASSARRM